MNLSPDPGAPLDISFLPAVHDEIFQVYPGIPIQGNQFSEFLRDSEILWPVHNIERKKRELAACDAELSVLSPSGMERDRESLALGNI